jgi:hypothetical protein
MNRFMRTVVSFGLLWLAASMLVSTLRSSILGLKQIAFLPWMLTAMLLAYLLGSGKWTARRSWLLLLCIGPLLVVLQASHTAPALWQILTHLPSLVWRSVASFFSGDFLNLSFFNIQLEKIDHHWEIFREGIQLDNEERSMTLIELSWEAPLFLVGAWAGWWTSRRNSILIALVPAIAVQVFLLIYAGRPEKIALQVGVITLIILMSFHQKWSLLKSDSNKQFRVRMETYAMIFILASVLVLASGSIPIVPAAQEQVRTEAPNNVHGTDQTNETIEKNVDVNHGGVSRGLPHDHLISSPPKNSMDVVFLANSGEIPYSDMDEKGIKPVVQLYYWRWITYDQYDGTGWSSSPTTSASYSADQSLFEFDGQGHRFVHQTIIKASPEDNHIYWTGSLLEANQPMDTSWRVPPRTADPLLSMDMLGSLVEAQQYAVDSLLPQFNAAQLREASQAYPTEILQKYLALPEDVISQRVRDLAATLTAEPQNPYDKAKAIETYLRTHPYTLDVPSVPPGSEISDYFLFDLKKGYCEYYATSMVVLARASGLPARIVIGYASDEYDPHSAQYIVRQVNAHMWVEIYFPEIGWVEFEPTAGQPLTELPEPLEDLNISLPLESAQKSRLEVIHKKHGYFVEGSPSFGILLPMLALMGMLAWILRMQGLWFSYKTIGSIYEYIYYHGRRIVRDATPNATPSLFAEELKAKLRLDHPFLHHATDELDYITSLYLKETYSPHAVTAVEQGWAVKIWHRLFWRLLYVRMMLTFMSLRAGR